jgi:integral membrane protein
MGIAEMYRSPVGKLRVVGFLEGLSFVALVGIGMPLKYGMGEPLVVRIAGPLHGFLWVWLCLLIAQAVLEKGWSAKAGGIVFLASLFPLGPFLIDRWLKRQQEAFVEPA